MAIGDDLGRFPDPRSCYQVTAAFDVVFAAEAIQMLITPVRAAGQRLRGGVGRDRSAGGTGPDAYRGCRQLRLLLAEYADRYNGHRPHRASAGTAAWAGEPVGLAPAVRIVRRDRLGGLIHEYAQVA